MNKFTSYVIPTYFAFIPMPTYETNFDKFGILKNFVMKYCHE